MALCRAISMLKNKLTYKKTYVVPTVSFEPIEVDAVMNAKASVTGRGQDSGDSGGGGNRPGGDNKNPFEQSKAFQGDFVFDQDVFSGDL